MPCRLRPGGKSAGRTTNARHRPTEVRATSAPPGIGPASPLPDSGEYGHRGNHIFQRTRLVTHGISISVSRGLCSQVAYPTEAPTINPFRRKRLHAKTGNIGNSKVCRGKYTIGIPKTSQADSNRRMPMPPRPLPSRRKTGRGKRPNTNRKEREKRSAFRKCPVLSDNGRETERNA